MRPQVIKDAKGSLLIVAMQLISAILRSCGLLAVIGAFTVILFLVFLIFLLRVFWSLKTQSHF